MIDAQIVLAYFKEIVLDQTPTTTGSTIPTFERLGRDDVAYLDSGENILAEWRNGLDSEWFQAWYSESLVNDSIRFIETSTCQVLLRKLRTDFGFPAGSRDKWYIRVATAKCDSDEEATRIVSEDIHFHDPRAPGRSRTAILMNSSGVMAAFLRRNADIDVRALACHP